MSWLGHEWRLSDIIKDVLKWKLEGKKPLSRPKKRWIDEPYQNFRTLGIKKPEEMASDREE